MKKIVVGVIVLMLMVGQVSAKKPEEAQGPKIKEDACTTIQSGELKNSYGEEITTGFDEWGYNYQAHLFNGGYCDSYRDAAWCQDYKDVDLIMKWNDAWLSNKDCTGDGKLDRHYGFDSYIGSGAWVTNHQSGEYEQISWDVSGNWKLDFAGGTDNREFRNLVQDEEGNVTGEFWWLNGKWEYGGVLEGEVIEDVLTLHYERDPIYNYWGDFVATITEDGLVDGIFTNKNGIEFIWSATGVNPAIYETCSWNYFVKIVAAPADAYRDGPANTGTWYTREGGDAIGPDIWGEFAVIQEVSNDTCAGEHGLTYKSPVRAGLGNW